MDIIIKFESVQFNLRDFHKLFGSKLTTWSQGPCLDSSICVWFCGLQSLFITHIKRDLKGSSRKARSGCSQEGIYCSAIEAVLQKPHFWAIVRNWLIFNNHPFLKDWLVAFTDFCGVFLLWPLASCYCDINEGRVGRRCWGSYLALRATESSSSTLLDRTRDCSSTRETGRTHSHTKADVMGIL